MKGFQLFITIAIELLDNLSQRDDDYDFYDFIPFISNRSTIRVCIKRFRFKSCDELREIGAVEESCTQTLSNAALVLDDVGMVALDGNAAYRNVILHIKATTGTILGKVKAT